MPQDVSWGQQIRDASSGVSAMHRFCFATFYPQLSKGPLCWSLNSLSEVSKQNGKRSLQKQILELQIELSVSVMFHMVL